LNVVAWVSVGSARTWGLAVEAAGPIDDHHPVDQRADVVGEVRGDLAEGDDVAAHQHAEELAKVLAGDGARAGQALIQDDTHRPDVGALVEALLAEGLLGGHVVRGAEHRSGLREAGGLRGVALIGRELRDAEVEHDGVDHAVAASRKILRLEVAVDDAHRGRCRETGTRLRRLGEVDGSSRATSPATAGGRL
jgi:hypothetical protein